MNSIASGQPKEPLHLLTIKNLTVGIAPELEKHPLQQNLILENIDLDIPEGENICIMGESGSGKTTLVNAAAGIRRGRRLNISGSINDYGHSIFSVFQDVDLYLNPYQNLLTYVKLAFRTRNHKIPGRTAAIDNHILVKTIADIGLLKPLLEDLDGVPPYSNKDVQEALQNNLSPHIEQIAHLLKNGLKRKKRQRLSGGEKQKFYLLLALIANPDILVADEIFTDIDAGSRDRIVNLLFQEDNNTAIVFISHDIGMVEALMESRKLNKVYYLENKRLHKDVWQNDSPIPQWAETMRTAFRHLKAENVRLQDPSDEPPPHNDPPAIFKMGYLSRRFDDGKRIDFDGINGGLAIKKGINYALVGENGTGKTTLFKILTKVFKYDGEIIVYNGLTEPEPLMNIPRFDHVKQNQLVFQKTGNAIIEKITINQYLMSFFKKHQHRHMQPIIEELTATFFSSEKCLNILNAHFKELSVGEQRRILLIRALLLVDRNGILFVDEAMRGMDIVLKEKLVQYLKQNELQVLLISHDHYLRDALCRYEILLQYDKQTGRTTMTLNDKFSETKYREKMIVENMIRRNDEI